MGKFYKSKSGFTLVELSIVITIIALLLGSIVAAQSLLVSSETKTMLSEVQKLQAAISNFNSLYKGLPGDITNASKYWSGASSGNGNGKIDSENSTTAALQNEPFLAIQHINLAGLLEGTYVGFTGTWGSGFVLSNSAITGNVIGSTGRSAGGIYIKCCNGPYSGVGYENYDYSRTLEFNNHIVVFSVYSTITKRAGILTPIEAYNIDKKIDDGVPDIGLVGGGGSYTGAAYAATGCYSNTGSSSTYDTTVAANKDVQNCQMQFGFDWN